jgi:MFS family permease
MFLRQLWSVAVHHDRIVSVSCSVFIELWHMLTIHSFQSSAGTVGPSLQPGVTGIRLALWYAPTAVTGLIMCVATGALLHIVPGKVALLFSGLAWIAASVVFAACPYPVNYWAVVLPSMIAISLGLDLTYTVSLVYLSTIQPRELQGVCGAVCSILVNLAISFSLSISEMVKVRAENEFGGSVPGMDAGQSLGMSNWVYRSAFLYATASAGLGFVICVLFVHIPRAQQKVVDEEQGDVAPQPEASASEASTLVDDREDRATTDTPVNSAEIHRGPGQFAEA